jgi:C_GCAxxG_C_C family probable redox protein
MFWSKKKDCGEAVSIAEKVNCEAEGLYRSGRMHCAEAVLTALKSNFRPEIPDVIVQAAAGFGGGSGTGCICGAVSGATMALGLIFPDDKKRVKRLTQELHRWFKETYGATCCKVVLANHKGICAELTGQVAGKAAQLVVNE